VLETAERISFLLLLLSECEEEGKESGAGLPFLSPFFFFFSVRLKPATEGFSPFPGIRARGRREEANGGSGLFSPPASQEERSAKAIGLFSPPFFSSLLSLGGQKQQSRRRGRFPFFLSSWPKRGQEDGRRRKQRLFFFFFLLH